MIPIHILGGLKNIPHSSRTSVYTFIMEVTPPCPPPSAESPDFPVRKFVGQKRLENHGFIARTTESPRWTPEDGHD